MSVPRLALLIAVLFLRAEQACAEVRPQWSVDQLCARAELIIEGEALGNDVVRITKVHKRSKHLLRGLTSLRVDELDSLPRSLWKNRRPRSSEEPTPTTERISTRTLVLFANFDPQRKLWRTVDGMPSVFWVDDITCYGYVQILVGGYELVSASDEPRGAFKKVPASLATLRSQIAGGLENARRWQRALALRDPDEKAEALSRYLLARTSPPGDRGTYRFAVRAPMGALKSHAVGALLRVLRSLRPGDDPNEVVLILYDLGPLARSAVPSLCRLLKQPGHTNEGYVVAALRTAGDRRAISCVHPLLRHADLSIVAETATTLAALKDRKAFDDVAASIPNEILGSRAPSEVRDILIALHALDDERAKPIIERVTADPAMRAVADQVFREIGTQPDTVPRPPGKGENE